MLRASKSRSDRPRTPRRHRERPRKGDTARRVQDQTQQDNKTEQSAPGVVNVNGVSGCVSRRLPQPLVAAPTVVRSRRTPVSPVRMALQRGALPPRGGRGTCPTQRAHAVRPAAQPPTYLFIVRLGHPHALKVSKRGEDAPPRPRAKAPLRNARRGQHPRPKVVAHQLPAEALKEAAQVARPARQADARPQVLVRRRLGGAEGVEDEAAEARRRPRRRRPIRRRVRRRRGGRRE